MKCTELSLVFDQSFLTLLTYPTCFCRIFSYILLPPVINPSSSNYKLYFAHFHSRGKTDRLRHFHGKFYHFTIWKKETSFTGFYSFYWLTASSRFNSFKNIIGDLNLSYLKHNKDFVYSDILTNVLSSSSLISNRPLILKGPSPGAHLWFKIEPIWHQ